jgi:transposase
MIAPGADLKIYMATRPIDFRCGHDGLAAKVQEMLRLDPFSGAAFVFRSKRADLDQDFGLGSNGPGVGAQAPRRLQVRLANDRRRRDAHIASDVRSPVRGAGLEVGPPARSAASAGGGITAAE